MSSIDNIIYTDEGGTPKEIRYGRHFQPFFLQGAIFYIDMSAEEKPLPPPNGYEGKSYDTESVQAYCVLVSGL